MLPLCSDDRHSLLALARRAVLEFVLHHRLVDVPVLAGRLAEPGSAFVTLHCFAKLRGCIGRTDGVLSLVETVAQCAISAAAHDPRFLTVSKEDLPGLAIEISVLSEFQPLSPDAIAKPGSPEAIVPGTHGLLVGRDNRRGLLLPQVAAERRWSAERFLEETCEKAGLERYAWRDPQTNVYLFTAEVFSEGNAWSW